MHTFQRRQRAASPGAAPLAVKINIVGALAGHNLLYVLEELLLVPFEEVAFEETPHYDESCEEAHGSNDPAWHCRTRREKSAMHTARGASAWQKVRVHTVATILADELVCVEVAQSIDVDFGMRLTCARRSRRLQVPVHIP